MSALLSDPRFPLLSSFTDEERRTAVPVIENLIKLANLARAEGVLSLEEAVINVDNEFLKTGIRLVADGVDPDLVRDVVTARVYSSCDPSTPEGRLRFLHCAIEMEGMLSIQFGENPRIIEEKLYGYLGADFPREVTS